MGDWTPTPTVVVRSVVGVPSMSQPSLGHGDGGHEGVESTGTPGVTPVSRTFGTECLSLLLWVSRHTTVSSVRSVGLWVDTRGRDLGGSTHWSPFGGLKGVDTLLRVPVGGGSPPVRGTDVRPTTDVPLFQSDPVSPKDPVFYKSRFRTFSVVY